MLVSHLVPAKAVEVWRMLA